MANLFGCYNINRAILSLLLGSFSLTTVFPAQSVELQVGINEIAFIYRIEKLVDRVWKLEKSKDKDKMYAVILDIKKEIETSCGIKVDITKYMNTVESDLKKKGYKQSKKQFDVIRKTLKNKEKKYNKHAKYLAATMFLEGYELNAADEELMFSEHLMVKHRNDRDKDEKEEIYVPSQLVFGVTLTLCGLFLMVIPFPLCKPWGEKMIASGFVICGNAISGKIDNDHREEEKNKKQK